MANETKQTYTVDTEVIETSFTYHAPNETQIPRYHILREEAKKLAYIIAQNVPDSAEKTLARRHLEQAIMWANKAIAHERHPKQ